MDELARRARLRTLAEAVNGRAALPRANEMPRRLEMDMIDYQEPWSCCVGKLAEVTLVGGCCPHTAIG